MTKLQGRAHGRMINSSLRVSTAILNTINEKPRRLYHGANRAENISTASINGKSFLSQMTHPFVDTKIASGAQAER